MAVSAVLLACGAALGFLEAVLLPPLPLPGVRLGLANIAVVLALALVGEGWALAVSVGRVLVVGLATGSLGGPASALGLAGAVAAWGAMCLVRRGGERFSVIGWSAAGSVAHLAAQMSVATLVVGTSAILRILPVSLGASLLSGCAIGALVAFLLSHTSIGSSTLE